MCTVATRAPSLATFGVCSVWFVGFTIDPTPRGHPYVSRFLLQSKKKSANPTMHAAHHAHVGPPTLSQVARHEAHLTHRHHTIDWIPPSEQGESARRERAVRDHPILAPFYIVYHTVRRLRRERAKSTRPLTVLLLENLEPVGEQFLATRRLLHD